MKEERAFILDGPFPSQDFSSLDLWALVNSSFAELDYTWSSAMFKPVNFSVLTFAMSSEFSL